MPSNLKNKRGDGRTDGREEQTTNKTFYIVDWAPRRQMFFPPTQDLLLFQMSVSLFPDSDRLLSFWSSVANTMTYLCTILALSLSHVPCDRTMILWIHSSYRSYTKPGYTKPTSRSASLSKLGLLPRLHQFHFLLWSRTPPQFLVHLVTQSPLIITPKLPKNVLLSCSTLCPRLRSACFCPLRICDSSVPTLSSPSLRFWCLIDYSCVLSPLPRKTECMFLKSWENFRLLWKKSKRSCFICFSK